ncbi:restriction endonuclease [Streptomyces sp. SCSIO 30461]|uniref:McrC family protein n=1 Tax=Streptomyces sp. SCSIO 30461 TaxID=3118085 RepID=UPI0030D16B3F
MTRLDLSESGKAIQAELSPRQAAALTSSRIVRVEPGRRPGLWRISGNRLVGAARIGGIDVRIAPKTPVARLLFLLAYTAAPDRWYPEPIEASERDGLLPAVAYAFVRAAERGLRHGALQGYVSVDATLPVVRGRIRHADQLRRHFGRAFPVEASYEEFTEDIPENRILRSAARRLLALPGVPATCRPELRRVIAALPDVEDVPSTLALPDWTASPDNARLRTAIRLGELVLRGASYELDDGGTVPVDGLLINMEKVFEDFVAVSLREALRPYSGYVITDGGRHFLDEAHRIRLLPDVVWCRGDGTAAGVADAKYKADSVRGFPNADLYQMASYCLGLGLDRGHLIYAAGERPALRHTVRHSGIELIQHTVPLAAEPPAVLTAMSRIAAALANKS